MHVDTITENPQYHPPPQSKPVGMLEATRTGAVQFHRREAQLLGDVCVFDGQGFLHLRQTGQMGSFSDALSGGSEEQTLLSWGSPACRDTVSASSRAWGVSEGSA